MKKGGKIKVLFLADCNENSIQAQDRGAKNWALFLDPRKHDLSILCTGDPDTRLKRKDNIKIIYTRSKFAKVNYFAMLFCLFFSKYDVVILSKCRRRAVLIFNKYFLKRRKIVVPIVNQVPYEEKTFPDLVSSPNHVFAISSKIRKGIKQYANIDVPVVHSCFDLNMFKTMFKNNRRKKVVCVSSLQLRKQPFLFANIAKETPEADFIWIGDGYYMTWMKGKIQRENISNLTMAGILTQMELAEFLPQNDIFLFPSIHEGFPGAIAEAMACGLPVIAFDIYGPEAVIDGKTGYVVKSEFEMLEKLKYLLSNADTLKDFSVNARERAMDFEGSNVIHELEDYIDKIVRK